MQLLAENKGLQALHETHVKQTSLEIAELRAHLRMLVQEMEARQKEVETKAPIVKTRLEDYRDRLSDLRISESQYQELLSMPPEGLHVLDQIKVGPIDSQHTNAGSLDEFLSAARKDLPVQGTPMFT